MPKPIFLNLDLYIWGTEQRRLRIWSKTQSATRNPDIDIQILASAIKAQN
jgi:hypothetical protein